MSLTPNNSDISDTIRKGKNSHSGKDTKTVKQCMYFLNRYETQKFY